MVDVKEVPSGPADPAPIAAGTITSGLIGEDTPGEGHPGVNAVVMRYAVTQPSGDVRHQLILVTGMDDDGAVRGIPLGYEHEAARFATGTLV